MQATTNRKGSIMEETKFPPVAVKDLSFDNIEGRVDVDGYKAIVNPDTGHVYDIVSEKYKLVKHEEVLDNIESILAKEDKMGPYHKEVKVYQNGARIRAKYTFYEKSVRINNSPTRNDIVNPTLEAFNSYDRSVKHIVMLGAFRLICTNGMVVGIEFMQFRKRHMPDLYLDDVKQALEIGMDKMDTQLLTWDKWTEKKLEKDTLESTLKVLDLNKKETGILNEVKEAGTGMSIDQWLAFHEMGDSYQEQRDAMSWWIFYNILTQFTTHEIKSENRRLQLETRIRKALYN